MIERNPIRDVSLARLGKAVRRWATVTFSPLKWSTSMCSVICDRRKNVEKTWEYLPSWKHLPLIPLNQFADLCMLWLMREANVRREAWAAGGAVGPIISQEPASTRRTHWGRKKRQKLWSSEVIFMRAVDKTAAGDEQRRQHEREWKLHSFLYRAEACRQLHCSR